MIKAGEIAKSAGPTAGKVGRPRKDVTDRLDETLLDMAIQAMREANFAEISLERLAIRIGVSRPTLYRRFKTRDALLEAMVEREFSVLFQTADPQMESRTDPLAALRAHARRMLDVFIRPSTANFVKFQAQESMNNPRLADYQRQWHLRTIGQLQPLIIRAQDGGFLNQLEPDRLANLLISLLNTPLSLMNMGFTTTEAMAGLSKEAFFDWRFDIFLKATVPDPAGPA